MQAAMPAGLLFFVCVLYRRRIGA